MRLTTGRKREPASLNTHTCSNQAKPTPSQQTHMECCGRKGSTENKMPQPFRASSSPSLPRRRAPRFQVAWTNGYRNCEEQGPVSTSCNQLPLPAVPYTSWVAEVSSMPWNPTGRPDMTRVRYSAVAGHSRSTTQLFHGIGQTP